MSRPLIFGAALGGIVVFLWSFVSWTVLPWHKVDLLKFTNEEEVASVLARNVKTEGFYSLPAMAARRAVTTSSPPMPCGGRKASPSSPPS